MPAEGEWGFYDGFSKFVRVLPKPIPSTVSTNRINRHEESTFRGLLIDVEDNYSVVYRENLLSKKFWQQSSCSDKAYLNRTLPLAKNSFIDWHEIYGNSGDGILVTEKPSMMGNQIPNVQTTDEQNGILEEGLYFIISNIEKIISLNIF